MVALAAKQDFQGNSISAAQVIVSTFEDWQPLVPIHLHCMEKAAYIFC